MLRHELRTLWLRLLKCWKMNVTNQFTIQSRLWISFPNSNYFIWPTAMIMERWCTSHVSLWNNYRKFLCWHLSSQVFVVLTYTTFYNCSVFAVQTCLIFSIKLGRGKYYIRTCKQMIEWKRQLWATTTIYFIFLLHCSWVFCKPLLSLNLPNSLRWYCVSMQNCVQKMFLGPFIHMLVIV